MCKMAYFIAVLCIIPYYVGESNCFDHPIVPRLRIACTCQPPGIYFIFAAREVCHQDLLSWAEVMTAMTAPSQLSNTPSSQAKSAGSSSCRLGTLHT
jgi:hypothetical protein